MFFKKHVFNNSSYKCIVFIKSVCLKKTYVFMVIKTYVFKKTYVFQKTCFYNSSYKCIVFEKDMFFKNNICFSKNMFLIIVHINV